MMAGPLDPQLMTLVAEVKTAETALATKLAELHRYIETDRVEHGPLPSPASAVGQPERRTDLIGKEWIEAGVAASRFEISKGRILAWCQRNDDFGWKRGGRWYVSITKMRARLGIK
jgi:hypothetical protein